jgi:hypothetical protein
MTMGTGMRCRRALPPGVWRAHHDGMRTQTTPAAAPDSADPGKLPYTV